MAGSATSPAWANDSLTFGATPGIDYVSADLEPGAAMLTLDLERLDLPDAAFDWILCLHVLEHVADDRAAMGEL